MLSQRKTTRKCIGKFHDRDNKEQINSSGYWLQITISRLKTLNCNLAGCRVEVILVREQQDPTQTNINAESLTRPGIFQ
jgi:hypothetical protein